MYLNKDSLDVEIVSSKSSEMNVMLPTPSGDDYVSFLNKSAKTLLNNFLTAFSDWIADPRTVQDCHLWQFYPNNLRWKLGISKSTRHVCYSNIIFNDTVRKLSTKVFHKFTPRRSFLLSKRSRHVFASLIFIDFSTKNQTQVLKWIINAW